MLLKKKDKKDKQNINPACACHISVPSIICFIYLFLNSVFNTNSAGIFCFDVNSRMSKLPPCTRPDRLFTTIKMSHVFSSSDPKGHVSYCHHLAFVVRRKLFQKSSPLKVLDQWKPNLVWIITRVSSFKIVSGDAVHQPIWPLLLKIEHMVKLQVLGNNSKTVNNIKNLTCDKNDQHIKIYLPCNFEVNMITHLGVIALFSSNL